MILKHIKRLYQSVFLLLIAGFFIFLSMANPVLINHTDFSSYNTGWNGCSDLAHRTFAMGSFQPTLSYNQTSFTPQQESFTTVDLNPEDDSLFIIGPRTPFSAEEIHYVHSFVSEGGTLFLADDFGTANSLLSGLNTSSRFTRDLLLDLSFEKNASFVALFNFHHHNHPLLQNITGLLLNYPSSLLPSSKAVVLISSSALSWLDVQPNGKQDNTESTGPFPVLTEEPYGNGTLVLFSGPSLLINSMESYLSNQLFRSHLLTYLLDDKAHVVIDESHRERMIPFQLGYQFTTSIPSFLKISILLLAVILFLLLFTPIPQRMSQKLLSWMQPKEVESTMRSSLDLLEDLIRKHPQWNQRKLRTLIERMKTNE